MTKYLLVTVLAISAHAQNRELTIQLPGGAPIAMVWVDPGTFHMGALPPDLDDLDDEADERVSDQLPDHQVTITAGFWLGKFELTQAQWEAVMDTRPWANLPSAQSDPDQPAVFISWDDAQSFIHRLNQAAGDSLYRLPTEAEWEYACRAGTATRWSFGDRQTLLIDHAWYEKNAWEAGERYAHPAGTKIANPWGLYHMHGNAEEWVQDWYGATYYEDAPERDPQGPARGFSRVLRGGNYGDPAEDVQSSYRNAARPDFLSSLYGMRILARENLRTQIDRRSWGQVKRKAP